MTDLLFVATGLLVMLFGLALCGVTFGFNPELIGLRVTEPQNDVIQRGE